MAGVEDQRICLYLNKKWQVVTVKSVREVFGEFAGGHCLGVNIEYAQNEDGSYDFDRPLSTNLVSWEDWLSLPVRDCDPRISTAKSIIRIPTILVSRTYEKIPPLKTRVSKRKIWLRDKGICQYTGKKLDKETGNVDHVIPRDKGGENSWTNMVLSCKSINSKKKNKTPEEAGLKLLRQPKPLSFLLPQDLIEDIRHPDWNLFLDRPDLKKI